MRAWTAAGLAACGALLGSGAAACFDVLHATGDLRTACEIDAGSPGCEPAAAAQTVCAPSRAAARARADHACAWLGACETPMGRNALGSCVFAARLAFDCEANPDHRVSGKQAALWSCLGAARTCADVDACLLPAGVPVCDKSGSYVGCGTPGSGAAGTNEDVRAECAEAGPPRDGGARAENCGLWGQTCSDGVCSASSAPGCAQNDCLESTIDWCSGTANVGIDCAAWGSSHCAGFPVGAPHPQWVACVSEGDGGKACNAEATASCSGGVASSCPSGESESIDCAALLGAPPGAGCSAGALDPPFDWTSPCSMNPPGCSADSCDGGVATGCARGAAFSVDCGDAGLGVCAMRATDLGTQEHAACTLP